MAPLVPPPSRNSSPLEQRRRLHTSASRDSSPLLVDPTCSDLSDPLGQPATSDPRFRILEQQQPHNSIPPPTAWKPRTTSLSSVDNHSLAYSSASSRNNRKMPAKDDDDDNDAHRCQLFIIRDMKHASLLSHQT